MRKFGSIALLLLFWLSVTGISVNKHYCGGKLSSVTLFMDGGCACGDMQDESSCCRTESHVFKIGDGYEGAAVDFETADAKQDMIDAKITEFVAWHSIDSCSSRYNPLIPPLISKNFILLYQVFLI